MSSQNEDWVDELYALKKSGQAFSVITVTRFIGSTPRETGSKMILRADGFFHGSIGGGNLEKLVLNDAQTCLEQGQTALFTYPLGAKAGQCCGGSVEVLIETLNCGPRLFIFGAGHVAQAICRVLQDSRFSIDIIDPRPDWLGRLQASSSLRLHQDWRVFTQNAHWSPAQTYAVILTHSHALDEEILGALLQGDYPYRYLGLIGSRAKWLRFQKRLLLNGISQQKLLSVSSPIGMAIGGKAPTEVAISLAAELQALLYDQSTQPLSLNSARRRPVLAHGTSQGLSALPRTTLDHGTGESLRPSGG